MSLHLQYPPLRSTLAIASSCNRRLARSSYTCYTQSFPPHHNVSNRKAFLYPAIWPGRGEWISDAALRWRSQFQSVYLAWFKNGQSWENSDAHAGSTRRSWVPILNWWLGRHWCGSWTNGSAHRAIVHELKLWDPPGWVHYSLLTYFPRSWSNRLISLGRDTFPVPFLQVLINVIYIPFASAFTFERSHFL